MMKKWIISGIISFGILFAYVAINERDEFTYLMHLSEIESLAYGEVLPDVEIVCGSTENKGRCWDGECSTQWTPFGWYSAWDCYNPTGNINDFCSNGVPC